MTRSEENSVKDTPLTRDSAGGAEDDAIPEVSVTSKLNMKSEEFSVVEASDTVKEDSSYLSKLLRTCWFCLSFISLGFQTAELGPSLLDLLMVTESDFTEGSTVVVTGGVGYLLGAILYGILLDPVNNDLLMFLSLVGGGLLNVAMPLCPYLSLMAIANFLRLGFSGIIDTGINTACVTVWGKDSGPYMQSLHLAFAFGALLAPLVVKPFLGKDLINSHINTTNNISTLFKFENVSDTTTSIYGSISQTHTPINSSFPESNSGLPDLSPTTSIHWAYMIIGIFTIISALPFGFNFLRNSKVMKPKKTEETSKEDMLFTKENVFPLTILLFFFFFYCSVLGTSIYLTSFLVKYLGWSKEDGSMATFVFWVSFAGGRFMGIFLLNIIESTHMLLCDLSLLVISGVVLQWSKSFDLLIWIFYGVLGFAIARIFPTGFTWTENYLFKMSGTLSSAILVCTSAGISLNPVFLAYMMEKYTPRWFLFISLGESMLCFCCFFILIGFTKFWKNKDKINKTLEL